MENLENSKMVIVAASSLGRGEIANRAAVLSTGIAARLPEIVGGDVYTSDGITLPGITRLTIPVLTAAGAEQVADLAAESRSNGCLAIVYLTRLRNLHSYDEYERTIASLTEKELDIDTVLLFGPRKIINKMTGSLPIMR